MVGSFLVIISSNYSLGPTFLGCKGGELIRGYLQTLQNMVYIYYMVRSNTYPYPPRPGTNLQNLEFNDSSYSLDERLNDVIEFEHQLYNASLNPDDFPVAELYKEKSKSAGVEVSPVEEIWKLKTNSTDFGVNYFLTSQGKQALEHATGITIDYYDEESCASFIAALDTSNIESEQLDKLEANSIGFEEKMLSREFIDNGFKGDSLASPGIVTVYKNPSVLLDKVRGYKKIKGYIVSVIEDLNALNGGDDDVVKAKLFLADLYRQKINVLIADNYISSYKLAYQSHLSKKHIHEDILKALEKELPAMFTNRDDIGSANFMQRIDRFRHGVARNEDNSLTWLSSEAKHLATEASQEDGGEISVDRGLYADIDPDTLENKIIDSETFGNWIKTVLADYGLLSEYDEWSSERTTPAFDGKWQVIVSDKFKSLAVNDKQRIIKVPSKSVAVLKALTLANHEIAHVVQHENKRAISSLAILERIGVDNASYQSESGGIWQEQVANEILRGTIDTDVAGTGYYQALLVKDSGGSFGECVQAYFEDLTKRNPDLKINEAVDQAVNRARRIFRFGGLQFAQDMPLVTNTQPLNYLEQRLVYQALREDQRKLLFIGGIAIHNLVQMSELGLVDLSKIFIPEKMPIEVLFPQVMAELLK